MTYAGLLMLPELKRAPGRWINRLPQDLLDHIAQIDDLPPLAAPVYRDNSERDELAARCKHSLLEWCTEALRHEGLKPAAHHRLLIEHLQAVADGHIPRLMIFMPPGSAKSKYTSELLPAWCGSAGRRRNQKASSRSHATPRTPWHWWGSRPLRAA